MYTIARRIGIRQALQAEAPSAFAAMVLAERFYKFHSFTLECLAFLATWYAVSVLLARLGIGPEAGEAMSESRRDATQPNGRRAWRK